ncbi:hypothetical protein ACFYVL_00845 [Streptomyces sp. NPDC004111]|uniref:hypothetical protein n=1 Tax=Streptomyces sp. NPDC004111 TaxID=3364690 RepID=UPI0036A6BA66
MDHDLQALRGADWEPFAAPESSGTPLPEPDVEPGEEAEAMVRGFGLAMLEFVATAARDEKLIGLLRARVEVLLQAYGRAAAAGRPEGEHVPVDDIAQLMTALDQGVSVLRLSGIAAVDGALMRTGLRRLLDPAGAAVEPSPVRGGHASHMPDVEWVRSLTRDAPDA